MNHRNLERQQQELLARSSYLRARLGAELGHWQRPLSLVDGLLMAMRWLGSHPLWGVATALTLTTKGPRRFFLRLLKGLWQRAMP